jgi:hypothetical protein
MANVTFACVHNVAVIPKVPVIVIQRESMEQRVINIVPGTPLEVLEAIVAVSHDIYRKLARGLIKVTAGNLPAEAATAAASTHPTTTPISAIVTN